MRSALVLAIGILSASATAQLTNILPTSANGVAGGSNNVFPWGTPASGWPGLRIMTIYDSSHFTSAPVPISAPILITNIRWRADDTASSWTGGTYSAATLSLGTAAVDYTAATTNWTSNTGGDYTQVHNGPVTVMPGTGNGAGVPGPYFVDITVSPPFLYDPNAGDLVVDTNWTAGAWTGGSQTALDVMSTNILASRVYASTNYPNANGVDQSAPIIEVVYTPGGPGTVAFNTSLGAGCISAADVSSYENFASSAAFDLANTSITLLNTGAGYLALPGITTYVPPTGSAQVLGLSDDSETTVTLSQTMPLGGSSSTSTLTVCSNGFISSGTGNGTTYTPTPSTFLNGPRTWWSLCWHDYNPSGGGGQVKFEEIAGVAYITWDGVWDFGGASVSNANTMQAQFELTTGHVHFVYGTMSTLGNGRLVGFSDAGPSADPGSMDISAALPASYPAAVFAVSPLALAANTRPIINTSWNLTTSNVPATGVIGVDVFGLADPGINDLSFIGMPGCGLRASLDVVLGWPVSGNTHAFGFPLPNNPSIVNAHVFVTSAVFQVPPVNSFGAITSNGIDGRLGDL